MSDFERLSGHMNCRCDFLTCLSIMDLYGRFKKNIIERLKGKAALDLDHDNNFLAY